jgi:YidC/Oxa1 family membrane protein insertase
MDQARVFIAIALSFLIFLAWDFFFSSKTPPEKPQQSTEEVQKVEEKIAAEKPYVKEAEVQTAVAPQAVGDPVQAQKTARTISVQAPFYSAKITEQGAAFSSLVLNEYKEFVDNDSPLKELVPTEVSPGTVTLGFHNQSLLGLEQAVFTSDFRGETLEVSDKPADLKFTWVSQDGVVVEKKYHFEPESYLIGLSVTLKNGSTRTIQDRLYLSLLKTLKSDKSVYGFTGPSALINGKLEQIDIDDIEDKDTFDGDISWIAIQDRYFMSSIIPKEPIAASMRLALEDEKFIINSYLQPQTTFHPGTQQTFDFDLFQGPKSMKLLRSYNNNLDKAINFGMFDILAKPCLWLMNFIYENLIPNYGIAIIILTLITKGLLWPLGTKSYKSMSQMKKMQPLIQELKEKHKDDRKKMNEATMSLYRTYKINPLGGCLPMVVQIPVFFALYRMLYEAIELRHAPFLLWINDLSAPDRLFNFNFSIPFMQPPYGIPVLTLIMGASMLLQQKMSPPMGDSTQAKMMMLMPIVFTFIFINFSSGLVLYWLINNIFSMGQQYYISKKYA